jgi:hypothetical protein
MVRGTQSESHQSASGTEAGCRPGTAYDRQMAQRDVSSEPSPGLPASPPIDAQIDAQIAVQSPAQDAPRQGGLQQDGPLIEIPPGRPWLSLDELHRLMRQQGLVLAIAQAWVLDEVVRAVPLGEHAVTEQVRLFLQQEGVDSEEARQAWMASRRFSDDDLRWFATRARRLEIFRNHQHAEDVELRFLERKLELDQVTYSLIRVEDQELAEELYQQIREGEADFADLAPIHSQGQERHTRGVIGPVPLALAHPALVNRLRTGEPGQIWEPFHLVNVWLILRMEQRFPAQLDQATRDQLIEELFDLWFQERVRLLMAGEPLPSLPRLEGGER